MRSVSGECMQGDSAGSNPRFMSKKRGEMKIKYHPYAFLIRSSRW